MIRSERRDTAYPSLRTRHPESIGNATKFNYPNILSLGIITEYSMTIHTFVLFYQFIVSFRSITNVDPKFVIVYKQREREISGNNTLNTLAIPSSTTDHHHHISNTKRCILDSIINYLPISCIMETFWHIICPYLRLR